MSEKSLIEWTDSTPVTTKKQSELKFHPLCDLFPPLDADAYAALKAQIKANGQLVKIPVHGGVALDGRARHRACRELGKEPLTEEVDVRGMPAAAVLAMNVNRRHLTSGQRAALAAKFAAPLAEEAAARMRSGKSADGAGGGRGRKKNPPQIVGEGNGGGDAGRHGGEADQRLARMAGTNREYVAAARHIEAKDPRLLARVASGELSLKQAEQQALGVAKGKGAAPPAPAAGDEWKEVATALDSALGILTRNRDAVEEGVAGWAGPEKASLSEKLTRIRERVDATLALLGGEEPEEK